MDITSKIVMAAAAAAAARSVAAPHMHSPATNAPCAAGITARCSGRRQPASRWPGTVPGTRLGAGRGGPARGSRRWRRGRRGAHTGELALPPCTACSRLVSLTMSDQLLHTCLMLWSVAPLLMHLTSLAVSCTPAQCACSGRASDLGCQPVLAAEDLSMCPDLAASTSVVGGLDMPCGVPLCVQIRGSGPQLDAATGWHAKRQEFDPEWDNDAETAIAEIEFRPDDTPQETAMKLRDMEIYNKRLDEVGGHVVVCIWVLALGVWAAAANVNQGTGTGEWERCCGLVALVSSATHSQVPWSKPWQHTPAVTQCPCCWEHILHCCTCISAWVTQKWSQHGQHNTTCC